MACHARREWRQQALDRAPQKVIVQDGMAVQNSLAPEFWR
jgi:hypothetical protein